MLTIKKLKKKTPIFLNNWKTELDVFSDFEEYSYKLKEEQITIVHKDEKILFASYGTDNYSGDAFVLFEKNDKLFEVNGSHCSCYGLENQWEPEETTIELLTKRLIDGKLGFDDYSGNVFHTELKLFLEVTK
jgi:hypothetical protein